jgi:flagellar biosynthetic protein FliR
VDIQTGFGLVNVVDPQSNSQVSILGQFYQLIALLFFLAINGHHVLLQALGDSFQLIPAGGFAWLERAAFAGPLLSDFFSRLFIIAFQVAAPSIATLFLANLTMGILSRTIPQMNVFIVGLPLNVMLGLGFTFLSMKVLGTVLDTVMGRMAQSISQILKTMAS